MFVAGIKLFFGLVAGYILLCLCIWLVSAIAHALDLFGRLFTGQTYQTVPHSPRVNPAPLITCLKCWEAGHTTKECKRKV
jgi:hypothetical protein